MANEKRRMLDSTMAEVKKMMEATSKELGNMQHQPVGVEYRTPKEKRAYFDRVMRLPDGQRNTFINNELMKSEHKGAEYDGCETCKFLEEGFKE